MFVPQTHSDHGLGRYVNNIRGQKKLGRLKSDVIAELDKIGFVWIVEKGVDKTALIEWGKQFRLLVDFQKVKGHCNVPPAIGGVENPLFEWCNEQRRLHMTGALDQGNGFDFYGSSEDDAKEEPVRKKFC